MLYWNKCVTGPSTFSNVLYYLYLWAKVELLSVFEGLYLKWRNTLNTKLFFVFPLMYRQQSSSWRLVWQTLSSVFFFSYLASQQLEHWLRQEPQPAVCQSAQEYGSWRCVAVTARAIYLLFLGGNVMRRWWIFTSEKSTFGWHRKQVTKRYDAEVSAIFLPVYPWFDDVWQNWIKGQKKTSCKAREQRHTDSK